MGFESIDGPAVDDPDAADHERRHGPRAPRNRVVGPVGGVLAGLALAAVVYFLFAGGGFGRDRGEAEASGSPGAAVAGAAAPGAELVERLAEVRRSQTVLSESHLVDRKYRSMMGPWGRQPVVLGDPDRDELVWITGYRAVMKADDGETPMAQEFMCHSNLDIDVAAHRERLAVAPAFSPRLFTLSQGQFEVRFPDGFGIPVRSSLPLDLTTQVLNLNHEIDDPAEAFGVRHEVTVEYALDREVGPGMVPLLPTAAYGLALTEGEDGYFGVDQPDAERHGPGCLVGETASDHAYEDGLGRVFTGHWQVPPGRQVNRTLVTHLMGVPYTTTLHYVAVHLHPFAQTLTLRDLTAGTTVFESRAENAADQIGLVKVEALSSAEGIPIHPHHEYELVSVYDNTSGETQDSMAVMYLYLRDLELESRLTEEGRLQLGRLEVGRLGLGAHDTGQSGDEPWRKPS